MARPWTLVDIGSVLWRWKKQIVGGTLLAAVLAVGVNLLLPETFQADAVVRLGSFVVPENGQVVPLEEPAALAKVVVSPSFLHQVIEHGHLDLQPEGLARDIEVARLGGEEIEIRVLGKSPEAAVNVLNAILETLEARHHDAFERAIATSKQLASEYETQAQALRVEIASMQDVLAKARKGPRGDVLGLLFLQTTFVQKRAELTSLERQVHGLALAVSPLRSRMTQAEAPAFASSRHVKPKRGRNVAATTLAAALLLGAYALIAEGVRGARPRKRENS